MLSIPKDINYKIPEISEEDFNDTTKDEDQDLIESGGWDDPGRDEEE